MNKNPEISPALIRQSISLINHIKFIYQKVLLAEIQMKFEKYFELGMVEVLLISQT